ncbi:MAG TPA: hypothetical protein P5128_01650 [Candidatus Sumerlaeia bacterium]|nr:MAG: Cell division protein FtsL [candidate division BRC1 bacterium ADurb.Bin183]HRR98932.1 hypothetical protein [Candidatus Sumerlaeia bacterium]
MAANKKTVYRETPVSLNARTMFFFLFVFGALTFFSLAHIYLQFKIRDLKIETVMLQDQGIKLADIEKNLIGEIARLNQGDRLHEFACTELGLRDVAADEIEKLIIPQRTIAKYTTGGRKTGYEETNWIEARYPRGFKEEVGSFIKINHELSAREQSLDLIIKELTSKKENDAKKKNSDSSDKKNKR